MDEILLSADEEDFAVEAAEPSPLFELSSLMAELPVKRGLSKFFNGKSQSFSSLSQVRRTEDLVKKECLFSKRRKICRSMKKIPYYAQNCSSRLVSKKASGNSSGSVIARSKSTPAQLQKSYLYVFIKGEDE